MRGIFRVTRRDFLRSAGVGAGAVVFGSYISPSLFAAGFTEKLINGFPVEGVPFVALKLNGDVVIITHRSEMGQGIRSSLAAVLADDMEADWDRVTLRQADADGRKYAIEFPFDVPPTTYTKQRTFVITAVTPHTGAVVAQALVSPFPITDPNGKGNVIPLILANPFQLFSSGPNSSGTTIRIDQAVAQI